MILRFCANISMLFPEIALQERIGAARQANFEAVEILFPYEDNAASLDTMLRQNDVELALINCPPPNYTGGVRGFAAIPGREQRFERDLMRCLRYAKRLRARHVHLMAGASQDPNARATFVRNLRLATEMAPEQSFTIEPINQKDVPDYVLSDFDMALEILKEVGAANLSLQFDTYHAHMITGDVLGTWDKVREHVRHIQIADAPGRGAPGTGDIDFKSFFETLRTENFDGWISAEYTPGKQTEKTLAWRTF